MDPSLITSLTSTVAPTIIRFFENTWKERIADAMEEYRNKLPETLTSPLEHKRRKILNKLSELQARGILGVTNKQLLQKVSMLLLELMAEAYEAKLEQDLDFIERRANHIDSILDRDDQDRAVRYWLRIAAVIISLGAFIGLCAVAILVPANVDDAIPLLSIPLPILIWGAFGSITALLYRFNNAGDAEIQDPLRFLITRPLTGVMMAVVAYLVVSTGLLAIQQPDNNIGTNELMWLVAFLSSFSDTFSDGILKRLMGQFGNDQKEAVLTYETLPDFNLLEVVQSWSQNTPIKKGASEPPDPGTPSRKERGQLTNKQGSFSGRAGQGNSDILSTTNGSDTKDTQQES